MRCHLRFFRKVYIRTNSYANAVQCHRLGVDEALKLRGVRLLAHLSVGVGSDLRFRRIRYQHTRRSIKDDVVTGPQPERRVTESHNGWKAERTGENCHVRRARPGVSSDRCDRVAIELDG